MRGSKSKAIRRSVRAIVGLDSARAKTEYEVISHPTMIRELSGEVQTHENRQLIVSSSFRRMILDTKKIMREISRGNLKPSTALL